MRALLLLAPILGLAACVADKPRFQPGDGGPDAGVDGGRDPGRDAGRDARVRDALVEDAEVYPDAAAPDADPVDTGEPPDVGVPDLGVPDSGVPADVGVLMDPLVNAGGLVVIQESYALAEGPVWSVPEQTLYFTDIQPPIGTNDGVMYRYVPGTAPTSFLTPTGQASGLALAPDGTILLAEFGGRRLSRRQANGTVVTVTERFMGARYTTPNDVVVRSDGTIYFTDSGQRQMREIPVNGVYRLDPAGTVTREVDRTPPSTPNGLALSYDESILYLSDQQSGELLALPIRADGSLVTPPIRLAQGVAQADGIATDEAGNIFVACQTGIRVFAPTGMEWPNSPLVIAAGLPPGNVTFGGANRDLLYATATFGLYSFQLMIPGRD